MNNLSKISRFLLFLVAIISVVTPAYAGKPKVLVNPHMEACSIVADAATRGTLDRFHIRGITPIYSEETKQLFAENDNFYGNATFYLLADINGDETPEHVVISDDGTAHVSTVHIRSSSKGVVAQHFSNFEDGYMDISLLKVNGNYYFLASQGEIIGILWRFSLEGNATEVCRYTQLSKRIISLVNGKERSVCVAAAANKIQHAKYSLQHAIGSLSGKGHFSSWDSIDDGLTKIDIDNDGRVDNVVRINFNSGAGRGCDSSYFAVTNDTRTQIPENKLNGILRNEIRFLCDEGAADVFVHDNAAYVDMNNGRERFIYQIQGEKLESVCEFRGRPLFKIGADSKGKK